MATPLPSSGRVARHEIAGFSVCEFRLPPGYRMETHAHDRSGLVLPLAGRFRARAGRRVLDVAEDRVAVLPGDAPHHETVGARGARCLLVIPGPARERAGLDLDDARAWRGPERARAGRLLARELGDGTSRHSLFAESLLLGLFAGAPGIDREGWSVAPDWVRRVEELVQDRFADPISHAEIAGEVGVTREHLARSFRRYAGMSLGSFVRRVRVLRAARELREGSRPIAQVAVGCGFADHSHLGRVFRRHFRLTPGQYRARLRGSEEGGS